MPKEVTNFKVLGEVIQVADETARNSIQQAETEINSIKAKEKTELVVLGDSYAISYLSDGTTSEPNVADCVGEQLGLTVHNYAIGGSGYTVGTTFSTQLDNAIADTSFDHSKVKYVLVLGGINDMNFNKTADHKTASKALQNRIANNFPSAEIIIVPNWAAPGLIASDELIYRNICTSDDNHNNKVRFFYDNLKLFMGWRDLIGSDNIHPTVSGYKKLSENIASFISNGSYVPSGKNYSVTPGTGWNTENVNIYRGENHIRIYGSASATQTITTSEMTIFTADADTAIWAGNVYPVAFISGINSVVPLEFIPGNNFHDNLVDSKFNLYFDMGTTITSGSSLVFDVTIPLLNY